MGLRSRWKSLSSWFTSHCRTLRHTPHSICAGKRLQGVRTWTGEPWREPMSAVINKVMKGKKDLSEHRGSSRFRKCRDKVLWFLSFHKRKRKMFFTLLLCYEILNNPKHTTLKGWGNTLRELASCHPYQSGISKKQRQEMFVLSAAVKDFQKCLNKSTLLLILGSGSHCWSADHLHPDRQ